MIGRKGGREGGKKGEKEKERVCVRERENKVNSINFASREETDRLSPCIILNVPYSHAWLIFSLFLLGSQKLNLRNFVQVRIFRSPVSRLTE